MFRNKHISHTCVSNMYYTCNTHVSSTHVIMCGEDVAHVAMYNHSVLLAFIGELAILFNIIQLFTIKLT